jgi:opacity protein-like surface antigen
MKKMMLLGALLVCAAAVGNAQESRQDFSANFIGVWAPDVNGLAVEPMHTTSTGGFLGSYRYDLTPRSGLELNYSFAQNSIKYHSEAFPQGEVATRQQEVTAAYVYSRSYGNYNPFVEGGGGTVIFTPTLNNGTHEFSTRQSTALGGLFGAGLAYEISPSFDIRIEYRGFVLKAPDFGVPGFETNRYYVLMTPSLGVAYHF